MPRYSKGSIRSGLAVATLLATAVMGTASAQAGNPCLDATARAERSYSLPAGLLTGIARIESGRGADSAGRAEPWPWSINVAGVPLYLDDKAAAVQTVRDLLVGGEVNIDVGCMQVNLSWHGESFGTLEDILDPAKNVDYAARHLVDLYRDEHDWLNAAGRYHGGDASRRMAYVQRLGVAMGGRLPEGRVVEGSVERSDTLADKASRALAAGNAQAALGYYAQTLAKTPDDRTARLGTAVALDRMGREAEAFAAWTAVLVQSPQDIQAARRLASFVRALPADQRLAATDDLIRSAPQSAIIASLRSEFLAAQNSGGDAAAEALRAAGLAPQDADIALNAAVLCDRADLRAEAITHYQRFLDLDGATKSVPDDRSAAVRRRITYLHSLVQG